MCSPTGATEYCATHVQHAGENIGGGGGEGEKRGMFNTMHKC